ncbi:MAG: sigma-70 family RNA polymerase sigma factor [Gammaproteobacteria bacterium]
MNPIRRVTDLAAGLFHSRGEDLLGFLRRRVRSDADARDIAQETYLRFIRLADPSRIDNPEAYLFRIAANLLWEHRLRQQQPAADPLVPENEPAVDHTPLDIAVSHELARNLKSVLSELPATPRAVLVLHLRDGLTYGQIGAQIGVSDSMVKKHLNNAVALCRRRLRDLRP